MLFIVHPSFQLMVVIIVLSYKFLMVGRVDLGTLEGQVVGKPQNKCMKKEETEG